MKQFFALLCALMLSVSLVACRSTGNNSAAQNSPSNRGASNGDSLLDDAERGLEDAKDDLEKAGDTLNDDLDRMIENGDLTDGKGR